MTQFKCPKCPLIIKEEVLICPRCKYPLFNKWKEIAEGGDADAQRFVGDCYAAGNGVEADLKEAARFYGLAAAQGNEAAKAKLAAIA